MAVTVTLTGPAAGWADLAALRAAGVETTDRRSPVVLVVVDAALEPSPADLELIRAVSGATGRCAVALAGDDPAGRWRAAVPDVVPVARPDAALARELEIMAAAPPDPVDPGPGRLRREGLRRALEAERAGRSARRLAAERAWRAAVPAAIADALDGVAPDAAAAHRIRDAADLDAASRRAALRLADALGTEPPQCPPAPERPRRTTAADAAVAALTLGAGLGAGRMAAEPLVALGAPPGPATAAALILGTVPAAVVVVTRTRARGAAGRAGWIAAHLGRLRRAWERGLAGLEPPPPPDGWRARHLAAALEGERR
ncbi:hypothetical protein [Corynebacterium sp.]|uniref:hypothetical protein n=1 Tax=Corynebacterium sp. TaxID=1720 RepID=UPI0026DC6E9A|nr:hypothetical protein [Corynebacterium sp.]MDO4610272.1 hypothetical protein [Corynebacterium sp.]